MTYYVMLIVYLANGQVVDYKPASESLYRFESECQNQVPDYLMAHPEYNNPNFLIECGNVQR